VGIIGIPYDGAVTRKAGAREAPSVLRKISKDVGRLTESHIDLGGLRLRDFGDIELSATDPEEVHRQIAESVSSLVGENCVLVTLGGDHSITSAVLEAYGPDRRIGVVWIDSHPDLMDSSDGISFIGTSKYSHACSLRRTLELPWVDPSDVLLIGIRNVFPEEREFIDEYGIDVIYARDLVRMSPQVLGTYVNRRFARLSGGVHISFDIDVLDPSVAPGTGVPVPGGINSRYLLDFVQSLDLHIRSWLGPLPLLGFDIVEISPPLDTNEITCMVGIRILVEMLGLIKHIQEGRR